tara:strand:+ start:1343 stop:1525 length:183 start_codon:yes stop_codon:yes gene_type:complete
MTTINEQMRAMFLDYFNNYLSVAKFAEHNEISEAVALTIITTGKELHEQYVQFHTGIGGV